MPDMPKKLKELLDGRKTYITAGAIVVAGILQSQGVQVPGYVWAALSALGLGFLRAGVKKGRMSS